MFFPSSGRPPVFPHVDKLAHAILFGVLAYLLHKSLSVSGKHHKLMAGLIASTYGALTEFFQRFLPSRSSDPCDLFADIFGVIIAIAIIQLLSFKR